MENIVPIGDLRKHISDVLEAIRYGVNDQRKTGLVVDMPEEVNFQCQVVFSFQALELRRESVVEGQDGRTGFESVTDQTSGTRTGTQTGTENRTGTELQTGTRIGTQSGTESRTGSENQTSDRTGTQNSVSDRTTSEDQTSSTNTTQSNNSSRATSENQNATESSQQQAGGNNSHIQKTEEKLNYSADG